MREDLKRKETKKMRQYGFNKATEFSKKQINVIYAKAKNNDLKVEKWLISKMYDLADYYGTDDNGSVAQNEQTILQILDKVFAGELEEAQEKIDFLAEWMFNSYTDKYQRTIDRSVYVA